ncbi:hypothetical protein ACIBKX_33675 [Streptomyces sp. NPDC050658]|uniref:hypothetical protein n=1 Tax=unclassified Streptomyces TaxID=2593676 RepID=UPI00343823B3
MNAVDLWSYLTPDMREGLEKKFSDRDETELHGQIEECLKFLYIASLTGRTFIPLCSELDDIWHELIVETRFYQDFCSKLPGGKFLHHAAIDMETYAEKIGKEQAVGDSLDWLPRYYHHFGAFIEERARWWSIVEFLRNEMGLTLPEINEVARSAAAEMAGPGIPASTSAS